MNQIINKDWIEGLKEIQDETINMCITSPPYWGLRDYGIDGQLGIEKNPDTYINNLCNGFDQIKRVLKNDGTCWINIADTYKNKSLMNIPFKLVIEMCNRGWIHRNTIIWHKPNAMPSSATDRFTTDFEYLFFFTKNKKYYFDQQVEPMTDGSIARMKRGNSNNHKNINGVPGQTKHSMNQPRTNDKTRQTPTTRNMRTVWNISTKGLKGAHFAVYPPELIETPIKAGCPQFICNKCGKPRVAIIRKVGEFQRRWSKNNADESPYNKQGSMQNIKEKVGLSDCGCNSGFHSGIVLDPFMGSGTTALVAKQLGRNYIGFELNPEYIEIANERLNDETDKIHP
jgi:DNA modification methylase